MSNAWSLAARPKPDAVLFNFATGVSDGTDTAGRLMLYPGQSRGSWTSPVVATPPGSTMLRDVVRWNVPQAWTKHPANPILDKQRVGPWTTWVNGVSVIPFDNGRKYRMFFCGHKGQGVGFADADANDPAAWTPFSGNPVFKGNPDNWEDAFVNQPRVVKVTETHWRMYYTGWGWKHQGGSSWAMGVADSHDLGVTWTRLQEQPFMLREPSPGFDDGGACVPMVIRNEANDGWLMWYTAGQINPLGKQNSHLCFARSKDGVTWEKYPGNPILTDNFGDNGPRSVTSRCYVIRRGGVYRMWYSYGRPMYRIHYAESLDGLHWERIGDEPAINVSPKPAWDDDIIEYPELQIPGNGEPWQMYHCGNGYSSVGLATGVPSTGVEWLVRTGDVKEVDATWGEWKKWTPREKTSLGKFAQLKAELWRDANARRGPVVEWVAIEAG